LLSQAGLVRLTDVLGTEEQADFGLAEPLAIVTLETEDGTYSLQVGARDDVTNSYVFNASNSPYYVRVAGWAGDAFVDKTRADFLAESDTEEPASTE
jgi:hypothetical protein